jgi:hypothetical protein
MLIAAAAPIAMLWYAARARRRARQIREPFPSAWRVLLHGSLPLYRNMPAELRLRLEPLVREFLLDVDFVGCQGLIVTDEMRLVIATQACLLIANSGAGAFRSLRSVLVYPDEFLVEESNEDEAGVVTEGTRVLSGQTFDTSRIVLSWRDVAEGCATDDAYNVVLHEFAHYLDHSVGLTERGHRALAGWHAVLSREYAALCAAVDRGESTLIDPYGAEHIEEFFAVATETFFEQPRELQGRHTHLYAELQSFYKLDPAKWPLEAPPSQ